MSHIYIPSVRLRPPLRAAYYYIRNNIALSTFISITPARLSTVLMHNSADERIPPSRRVCVHEYPSKTDQDVFTFSSFFFFLLSVCVALIIHRSYPNTTGRIPCNYNTTSFVRYNDHDVIII